MGGKILKKKQKNFRLFVNPRYLKGSVRKPVWEKDLEQYNQHRFKVFTAETRIDDKPPKLNPFNYVDQRKLVADATRLRMIDLDNKELLKKINVINRTIGKVDTYNPIAYRFKSNWRTHECEMKNIEYHNKEVFRLITSVQSGYSRKIMNEFWNKFLGTLEYQVKYPLVILQKTDADLHLTRQPSISGDLEKTKPRPQCFLEFQVKNGIKLGRVLVELYSDYVPVTVQNFLSICNEENSLSYKNCLVYRIIPGSHCETGDITKNTGKGGACIYGNSFPEEKHVLRHTKAGVLSMIRVGNQENKSQFCISFTNMAKYDHKNVVFGKIIKGIDNLFKIEGYGRKIGKPLAEIIISDCGEIVFESDEY